MQKTHLSGRHKQRRLLNTFPMIFALLLFVSTACSDDPKPNSNYIPGADTTDVNDGRDVEEEDDKDGNGSGEFDDGTDLSDADSDPDEDTSGKGDADDADDNNDADPGSDGGNNPGPDDQTGLCGDMKNLGTLAGSYQETFTVDFTEQDDRFRTTCAESRPGSAEAIFHFELEGEGFLDISSSSDVILELRGDACVDQQSLVCEVGAIDSYFGWPPRYLLVEKLDPDDPDEVEITLTYEQHQECDGMQIGESSCIDDEEIKVCGVTFAAPDEPSWLHFRCPDGCEDDRCRGDFCGNPIIVTDTIEFTAYQHVFLNRHNNKDVNACGPDGGKGEDLEGRELVFQLPDLRTTQEVVVELSHDSLYFGQEPSLLFKESCDDWSICVDFFKGDGEFTFHPPSDGTFYLFVDSADDFDGQISIRIEIRDNP